MMPGTQSTSPDELMRLEVAAQTRWTLLALWLSIQPKRVQQVLKRAVLIALGILAVIALVAYGVVRPLYRTAGEGVLVVEGALIGVVVLILTRPPGREIAGILAAAREHYTAQAQGRITTDEAAEHLGIELGIPLARSGDQLIGIDHKAQQHILVCAPTRAGKGLHLTTVLLSYPDSALVIDPKSEQYARTSGFRAQQGQTVYRIPGNSLDLSQFYDLCDGDDAAALHRQFLRPPPMSSDNAIFYFKSVPLFQAIGYYARVHRRNPIRALVAASASPMFGVLQKLDECPASHPYLRQFTDDLDPHDVDLLGSYKLTVNAWGTFTTALKPLVKHVDTIAPAPGAPGVIPPDWAAQGSSIYITYQLSDLTDAVGPLVSAVVAAMMRRQVKLNDMTDMLLAIDELAAVRLQGVATFLATMAGFNVRLLLYIQDTAQLDEAYRREAQTILSNCSSQVWYPTAEFQSAQHMSRLYGTKLHTSIGAVGLTLDPEHHRSPELRYSEHFMPALDPAEASSLPVGKVLVLMQAKDRQYRFIAERCDPRALLASLPPAVAVPIVATGTGSVSSCAEAPAAVAALHVRVQPPPEALPVAASATSGPPASVATNASVDPSLTGTDDGQVAADGVPFAPLQLPLIAGELVAAPAAGAGRKSARKQTRKGAGY